MSGFPLITLLSDPGWALPLLAKSTVVLALAGAIALGLRRASASARHMVWALALGALAGLPLLSTVLPRWKVPILPHAPAPLSAPVAHAPLSRSTPPEAPFTPYVDGPRESLAPSPTHDWPERPAWTLASPSSAAPPDTGVAADAGKPGWPRWMAVVWLAGVVLGLLQFLAGTLVVWRTARRASPVADVPWSRQLAEASLRLGLRRRIEMRMTDAVSVPVVWGWRRPVILVPRSAEGWSEEQRAAFLRHELAHVVRNDCLSQLVAVVVHAFYWPHPLVWWAVRRLRAEAERACDDRVLAAGTNGPDYAQYLLDAARELRPTPWIPSGSSAVVERTHLGDRLLALLDDGANRRAVGGRAVAVAGSLVVVVAAGLAALQPAARAAAVEAVRAIVAPVLGEQTAPKEAPKAPNALAARADPALTGTVKGPDGKPVEGALVIVKPSREWLQPVTARTDAEGRFRLPLPPRTPGPWDVTVDAKSLATATLERVTAGPPLAVSLQRGGVITGTVRDGNDGRPLGGARVVATTPSSLRWALVWQPSVGVKETETDKDGRFRIEGLARGRFEVTASASRYGRAQRKGLAAGSSADLLLFPGASISGTLVGPGNRPLPGAVVVAERRHPLDWVWAGTETTDAQGNFVFAGMDPGAYLLMARHTRFASSVVEVAVEALAESHVELALQSGSSVRGRLVDEQDRPVAGKVVVQEWGGLALPRQLAESLKVETGLNGVFVLETLPAGAHVLAVAASGFTPRRLEIETSAREKPVDLGNVALERGLTIKGRVTDGAGAPIADAGLYAYPVSNAPFPFFATTNDPTRSEPDGSFLIGGLGSGLYAVTASAPGYVTENQKANAESDRPLRLVLTPAGAITGAVVDAQRRPVDAFNVVAQRAEGDGNGYGAVGQKDVSSPDGRFRLDELAEGTYVVSARAPESAAGRVTGVKVVAGRTTDAGIIRLAAGGIVRGTVVDPTDAPVAGASVTAVPSGAFSGYDRAESQSDTSGAFELRGLRGGRTTVTATHPSYAQGRVTGLEVDPSKGPTEARIVVSPGGRIQGSVRRRDGTTLPGGSVSVSPRGPEEESRISFGLSAPVQRDGTYSIEHVPPGPASVSLNGQPSPGVSMGVQSRDVLVAEGQTAIVDFDSREVLVSGHVTRGETAQAGARVTIRPSMFSMSVSGGGLPDVAVPRGGPQPLSGVSRDDGSYELIALGPGPSWVEVTSADGKVSYVSRSLDLPDAESYVYDVRLGGAPVSGVVVDKEAGRAVAGAHVQAWPTTEGGGGAAISGSDGRFSFEVAPGSYKLRASAERYAKSEGELTVGEAGVTDLRLELSRGLVLEGTVVDPAGRPAPRTQVFAWTGDSRSYSEQMTVTMDDGTFRLEHLLPRPHTLGVGSPATGFAIRSGVAPGDEDVTLTLRPAGRIRLTVLDVKGAPVSEAVPSVTAVDGAMVGVFYSAGRTDAQGVAEFASPSGVVEVKVSKGKHGGDATVQVEAGATATARIVLGPASGS